MKKLFTLAICALLGGTMWAASLNNTPTNPFQDDLSRLDQEFAEITALEQLVAEKNATYSQLANEQNTLLQSVTSDNNIASTLLGSVAPDGERLLDIPGFWWGFCLGLLGVILVFVAVDGEAGKREGKKAIIGCIIGSLLSTLIYLVLWGAWAASAG